MGKVIDLRNSGLPWREVAAQAGLGSETAARRAFKREQEQLITGDAPISTNSSVNGTVLSGPKPLNVTLPSPIFKASADVERVLLYGDTHIPFQDPQAIDVVKQVGQILDPTMVVHMGDLMDFYGLSKFDKNPSRLHTVQDELDQARVHLAEMRLEFPEAKFYYLEGNHEARLTKALWHTEGTARALLQITKIREMLTLTALIGDDLGVEVIPTEEQTRVNLLPKLILKHGDVIRKWSGFTAKGEWERYGRSGASGHTHRLGLFFHGKYGGGAHAWAETGCTCTLRPEYSLDPDWQHGAMVLTVERETGAFAWEPVYIRDGKTVFRGNIIQSRV